MVRKDAEIPVILYPDVFLMYQIHGSLYGDPGKAFPLCEMSGRSSRRPCDVIVQTAHSFLTQVVIQNLHQNV